MGTPLRTHSSGAGGHTGPDMSGPSDSAMVCRPWLLLSEAPGMPAGCGLVETVEVVLAVAQLDGLVDEPAQVRLRHRMKRACKVSQSFDPGDKWLD